MLSPVVSTPLTFMLILQHLANLCQKLKTPRLSLNISFLYLLIVPLSIFFKKLSIPTALWLGRCFWNPSLARFAFILEFTIFYISTLKKNRILLGLGDTQIRQSWRRQAELPQFVQEGGEAEPSLSSPRNIFWPHLRKLCPQVWLCSEWRSVITL